MTSFDSICGLILWREGKTHCVHLFLSILSSWGFIYLDNQRFEKARSFNLQLGTVQDGVCVLGKTHVTPSVRGFCSIAFETVPVFVSVTTALSLPFKEDR